MLESFDEPEEFDEPPEAGLAEPEEPPLDDEPLFGVFLFESES